MDYSLTGATTWIFFFSNLNTGIAGTDNNDNVVTAVSWACACIEALHFTNAHRHG
jgi:hypothetical protein